VAAPFAGRVTKIATQPSNRYQATLGLNYDLRQKRLEVRAGYVFGQEAAQPVANFFHV
jgi:long-subunit fatty acid transport protein